MKTSRHNSFGLITLITTGVMVAFAANSIIGRAALKANLETPVIDPATYTTIRIICGAIVLWVFVKISGHLSLKSAPDRNDSTNERLDRTPSDQRRPWLSASMLALYAVGFSFAYVGLDAASGTLILFAFVQLTMIGLAALMGERPRTFEIIGMLIASGGLAYLLVPQTETPMFQESLLMAAAGIGWGVYSVLGKSSKQPIANTAANFMRAVPLVLLVSLLSLNSFQVTWTGIGLAAISGGVTSGLGYVLWYLVLPHLRATQAAVFQLSVPIIAAVGGALFAGDQITEQIIAAGVLIVVGIALTIVGKKRARSSD